MTPRTKSTAMCLVRALAVLVATLLSACGVFDRVSSPTPPVRVLPLEEARAAQALERLAALGEADVHVRLANDRLRVLMQQALHDMATREGALPLKDFRVAFGHQVVSISADLEQTPAGGQLANVRLLGEVRLEFSGSSLQWTPRFIRIEQTTPGVPGPEQLPQEILDNWLAQANASIAETLVVAAHNVIRLDYEPVVRVEAGVAVEEAGGERFLGSELIEGVFVTAAQAVLIEPEFTSALLDLEFQDNFLRCAPGLRVSRAQFSDEIRLREPQGLLASAGEDSGFHFFTEIQGASRPTGVVHYWFADGQPVGFESLQVEPSARWRTWSTRPGDVAGARIWEVVVVERDSGCVLASRVLRGGPATIGAGGPKAASGTYSDYRQAFDNRLGAMQGRSLSPRWSAVETRRELLFTAAVQQLSRVEIGVEMALGAPRAALGATLVAPEVGEQACARRDCGTLRVCQTAISRCVRQHDARDCRVCQFRNPLNNRCISEALDPVCEAARNERNRRLEADRQACQVEEERARTDCERSRAQETRSCELESRLAENVCSANLETLRSLAGKGSLAEIEGQAEATGTTRGRFGSFAVTPDFSSLRLEFSFIPDTVYRGSWRLKPLGTAGSLADCLGRWGGTFSGRLTLPVPRLTLVGQPVQEGHEWVTRWSGFLLPVIVSPTPMAAVFQDNPGQLADCGVALSPDAVQQAVRGADAGFLRGLAQRTVTPLPTRVGFGRGQVYFGEHVLRSEAAWRGDHLVVLALGEAH